MPRVTLADARASRIPNAIGVCATDARVPAFLNEACERLIYEGKWEGTFGRFKMCADNSCLTLPPQIATVERIAICGQSIPIHSVWWEFLENGLGMQGGSSCSSSSSSGGSGAWSGCCWSECIYRGRYPTFSDLRPTGKKVNAVCDLVSDVGKTVLLLGYDDNGNWIRTQQNSVWADGEVVAFAQSAGTTTANNFSVLQDVQLPDDMDGQSWLYEYDTTAATRRLIAHYQSFETRPSYARYFVPPISRLATANSCGLQMVEFIGKLEYIPVVNDTDYLIVPCIPALKDMAVAIKDAENEADYVRKAQIMATGLALAKSTLDSQLSHYTGDGLQRGISMLGSSLGSLDPVPNFV